MQLAPGNWREQRSIINSAWMLQNQWTTCTPV
jgi:hypothetical protein